MYRTGGTIECRRQAITERLDLISAEPFQFPTQDLVMFVQEATPAKITKLFCALGRPHNVGEQDRCQYTIDEWYRLCAALVLHFLKFPFSLNRRS